MADGGKTITPVARAAETVAAAARRLATVSAHARPRRRQAVMTPHCAFEAAGDSSLQATEEEPMAEMSAREKFLIDLNGFLVVPEVLSGADVAALNAATDACWNSSYTDGGGEEHPCRQRGHQSAAFHEMRGMLEWPAPHCLPFRSLLTQPKMIPYMNTLHGRGWRLDHSPFMIVGNGEHGGHIHGHPWDPEYKYRYANGVMRAGHLAIAYQLTDVQKDWGGFGVSCVSCLRHPLSTTPMFISSRWCTSAAHSAQTYVRFDAGDSWQPQVQPGAASRAPRDQSELDQSTTCLSRCS